MTKKFKKILSSALVVSSLLCSNVLYASAYDDGDRVVDYYDFDLQYDNNDDFMYSMSSSIVRKYNRNWVVSVNSVSPTVYPISYWVIKQDNFFGTVAIGNTAQLRGTGNTGNSYSTTATGMKTYLRGSLSSLETQRLGTYSSGQWSPDAPAT